MSQSQLLVIFIGSKATLYLTFFLWKWLYSVVLGDVVSCVGNKIIWYWPLIHIPVAMFYYFAWPPTPIANLEYHTNRHNTLLFGILGHICFCFSIACRVPLIYAQECKYEYVLWGTIYLWVFIGTAFFLKECYCLCICIMKGMKEKNHLQELRDVLNYATDPDNPDGLSSPSNPCCCVFASIKILALVILVFGIALLIWMLAIFPGLFAEVVLGSYNLCPSFSNVTANKEICDSEHYSSYSGCMWTWLGGCGSAGLILCGVVAFIILAPIALYKGYKELKLTGHWRGSLWQSFLYLFSNDNPVGLVYRLENKDDEYGEYDTARFSKPICCNYVMVPGFWTFIIIATVTPLALLVVYIFLRYVTVPMGYAINKMLPPDTSICYAYTKNTSYKECYTIDNCLTSCGRDGIFFITFILFGVVLVAMLVECCRKGMKAFKSQEEIARLKGEQEPLLGGDHDE